MSQPSYDRMLRLAQVAIRLDVINRIVEQRWLALRIAANEEQVREERAGEASVESQERYRTDWRSCKIWQERET